STVPIAADLPERPEAYPHAGNFGRLPAHGLFIRHATGITLRSTAFETARPDARPPVAEFDTRGLTIE
ncbi:MAG: glycoside hydrolase family 28 protein, partial [Lentisphaerae bacterium]|nr:glycoside hydrolase family 28 protein [Lentisphaerota bacterium]